MAEPDDDLQGWFDGLSFKLKRQLAGTIKQEADRLRGVIKQRAPRGKTGKLAESVKVRRKRNELELEVTAGGDETQVEIRKGSGVFVDRAMFPEFGTVNTPAQPFFFNTAREMMPGIRQNDRGRRRRHRREIIGRFFMGANGMRTIIWAGGEINSALPRSA
jgi:HK97 gp10 family phage protein